MSMEGQPPDDLQEAVAATLRRLRGESRGQQAGAARRLEPQLSSTPAVSPAPPAAPTAGAPTLAQKLAADLADQPPAEQDLLSAVTENSDIPPSPRNREALRQTLAAQIAADDAQQSRRRHGFRYAVILCLIVVLVGAGWWAYRNYAGRLRGGEVPVVSADQTPEKIPPASQAAAETPSDDKTVYDEIAPGAPSQQKSEVLLPQPEAPALPPAPASAAPSGKDPGPAATGAATESPPPTAPAAPDASASLPGPTVATTTGDSPASGASFPASAATSPASSAAPQLPATGATSTASTEEPQVPAAADTPTAPGNYRIQLAATKSEPAAETTWKRLATKYQDILASLTLHVEKTDLGSKGIYYRVQAGPFTEKSAAKDVCIKLKAQGQQCLVKP